MDPVLSVIIPCYNGKSYVRRAVESVTTQPESAHIEILIVNDGSTDGTDVVCNALASEYANVHVFHKENGGVSRARNLGIEKASGHYIAFLDCDDWWEPGFLDAETISALDPQNVPPVDVYQFSYRTVDKYRTLEKRYPVPIEDRIYSSPGFGRYDWAHPCSFFYRRSHLIKHHIQFPVAKVGEDGPFVEMALYCAESFSRRNRLMLTYWENMDSCLHTTPVLTGVKERYASALQEQQWLAQFGDSIDPNAGYVWQIAEHLPRICAENSFSSVAQFMSECCLPILARRPDIHFAPERQDRLDAWRVSPRRFWLKQKVKLGLPLTIKRICYLIPGLHRIVNHIYNKYHRGFTPIHN